MDRGHLALAASAGAAVALALERLLIALLSARRPADPLRRPAPHPGWAPPAPLPPPWDPAAPGAWHTVDPATTPADVMYPLVISAVVPRPIAFISTLGPDGSRNLAPYSYFNVVGHAPPLVAIGFCATKLRDHGKKDSLFNILSTKEFVVNTISEWFAEAANHTCGNFPYGADEAALAGLGTLPSARVAPPRVAESAVHLECVLRHSYAAGGSTVVIGEVVMWHVADGVAGRSPSGKLVVDPGKLRPVSRLGGNTYGRTAGLFDLPRPDR